MSRCRAFRMQCHFGSVFDVCLAITYGRRAKAPLAIATASRPKKASGAASSVFMTKPRCGCVTSAVAATRFDRASPNMDNKEYRDILAQEFSATGETGYADAVHGGKDDPIIDAALNAMRRSF